MTRHDIQETSKHSAKDERVIGKMHVKEFELGPEESTKVDERVTKYKERVERSRKEVLYKKVLYLLNSLKYYIPAFKKS